MFRVSLGTSPLSTLMYFTNTYVINTEKLHTFKNLTLRRKSQQIQYNFRHRIYNDKPNCLSVAVLTVAELENMMPKTQY